jgi:hypothetical protein
VACETWTDHKFGGERVVAAGTDPRRGAYVRVERTCAGCGKTTEETRWINEAANRLYAFAQWSATW